MKSNNIKFTQANLLFFLLLFFFVSCGKNKIEKRIWTIGESHTIPLQVALTSLDSFLDSFEDTLCIWLAWT